MVRLRDLLVKLRQVSGDISTIIILRNNLHFMTPSKRWKDVHIYVRDDDISA